VFLAQETRNLFRHHGTVKRSRATTAISLDLFFNNTMRVSIFKFFTENRRRDRNFGSDVVAGSVDSGRPKKLQEENSFNQLSK
jgi:hypothetical protein